MPHLLRAVLPLLLLPAVLGACSYVPVPPDPIRYVTSPADVAVCRSLGSVGYARTDGVGPFDYSEITVAVPNDGSIRPPSTGTWYGGREIVGGGTFAVRQNIMRDGALALGATDLFLKRRFYRDYSYVEGLAYRCPR